MGRQAMWHAVCALLLVSALGCHADDNDPAGQARELDDAVRREHAISRLTAIHGERLLAAKGDHDAPALREFNDATHEQLVKTYLGHPEDTQMGLRMLQLMADMRDVRTLPALTKALDWQTELNEDHAVAAASALCAISIPDAQKGDIISAATAAFKKVKGARGVDNRMRKGFIEVLGKLGDPRAVPVLLDIGLSQDSSQNFLFNKLAVQQLVHFKDPAAIDGLVRALYMFDAEQPLMRMDEEAESALLVIGRPALAPLMRAARGENPDVVHLVELSIAAFRKRDPVQAAKLNKRTLVAREAVNALGRLGYRDALPLLFEETNADDSDRRIAGAIALVGIVRSPEDTKPIVAALRKVYEKSEKQVRPQLLVAFRHLYSEEALPFLLSVARTTETELPPIQMGAWQNHVLLANRAESKALLPILEHEELIRPYLEEFRPVIAAADRCNTDVACWQGKLTDKNRLIVRKAANMLARYAAGNADAINALVAVFSHPDLEVRNEALSAVDALAVHGSAVAVKKIDDLQASEGGRSIWNNFSHSALVTRSRLILRTAT